MDPNVLFFLALKSSVGLIVKGIGKPIYNKLLPPIKRAITAAAEEMATELGSKFPSVNFLEYNFRFDSPIAKNELGKILSEREAPDENLLKVEMAKEIAVKWPEYLGNAEEIVNVFLKHFEKQCLAIPELQSFTIISIIKREETATRQTVLEDGERTRETIRGLEAFITRSIIPMNPTQEVEITKIASALEQRIVKDRDELIDSLKKWQSKDLYGKIESLAKEVLDLGNIISQEIRGSIFRLCGSYNLRSFRNKDEARYWIDLATAADPGNHKTLALQAEILCFENKWKTAFDLLAPIAELTLEPIAKIVYSECISHLSGADSAFQWICSQSAAKDSDEIKINIASLAIIIKRYKDALDILDSLLTNPFPGPYPYLLRAEIFANKVLPQEPIVMSVHLDQELKSNITLFLQAIKDLEKGIKLLETAARPFELAHYLTVLSELYIRADDPKSAEKALARHWKSLRKEFLPWFTSASIAVLKSCKGKALARARKALTLSGKEDYESVIRFGLICMNIEEWDKCLEALALIPLEKLGSGLLKGILQMKALCYHHKGQPDLVDSSIRDLKEQFKRDDTWAITRALILNISGKSEEAITFLESELMNGPESTNIKIRLAVQYEQNKNHRKAFPLFKDLAAVIENPKLYEEACKVGLQAEMPGDVISLAHEAQTKGILSEALNHFKAIALAMKDRYEEAYNLFCGFERDSLTENDHLFYASCLVRKAKSGEAIDILNRAKMKYPKDPRFTQQLCSLYLETNAPEKALEEVKLSLRLDPTNKGANLLAIQIAFAAGKQELAHELLTNYISTFGEGPELRSGSIEDVKKHLQAISEQSEFLWDKYQKGLLPEIILSSTSNFGIAGYRLTLLKSSERVMAFRGDPDSQKSQYINALSEKEVILDYHALITTHLLDLFEPATRLFQRINIPEVTMDKLREDLTSLSLCYQKDKREIQEKAFSKVKSGFQIDDKFPETTKQNIPQSIGNSIYDLIVCREKGCIYVIPGFEAAEPSNFSKYLNSEPISILELIDLIKEKGIITIKRYQESIQNLGKYRLVRLHAIAKLTPNLIMPDWNVIEMLEECNLLEEVLRSFKEVHVGPFSFALLRSEIVGYQRMDEIQKTLVSLKEKLQKMFDNRTLSMVTIPNFKKHSKVTLPVPASVKEYLDGLEKCCLASQILIWTDDLGLCNLLASMGIKIVSTRSILDALLKKSILTEEEFVVKIIQLLKWNMHFCGVNAEFIVKCAEMYGYSKGDDVRMATESITNEIKGFQDQLPNQIEMSNFNVASEVIQRLWVISEKAQRLAMTFFDDILAAIGGKEVLKRYWIVRGIISIVKVGEAPLIDFLRGLSFRLPGQIHDELKLSLRMLLEICLQETKSPIIQITAKELTATKVLRAVKIAIPSYADELIKLAIKMDPAIRGVI